MLVELLFMFFSVHQLMMLFIYIKFKKKRFHILVKL